MKTAISLPDDLFKAAESLAGRLGVSRSRLYATALEDYIARHQAKRVSERLDAVYTVENSKLGQTLSDAQSKILNRSEW
jgi:metal-responsive CopG/Arc/MetJ family transcriptional regulator